MITAIVVSAVALVLTATLLASGEHLDRGTFRDRKWQTALQVAEAGVQRTMAVELQPDPYFAGSSAGSVPGGQYETTVAPAPSSGLGRRSITSTAYVPSKNHPKEVRRRVRVIIGPPPSFKYALFGDRCLAVGNVGSPIIGDLFSNGHVFLDNGSKVIGDVYSSRGAVRLDQNAEVRKDGSKGGSVFSGGRASDPGSCISVGPGNWGIDVNNGSVIERDAHAQRPECASSPPASQYGITGGNTAQISGSSFSWGTVNSSINTGPVTQPICEVRPAPLTLPGFAAFNPAMAAVPPDYGYNKAFYTSMTGMTPTIWTTTAAFKLWLATNKTNLQGIHFIKQDAVNALQVIDLTGATITDHFILVTPGKIYRTNAFSTSLFDNTSAPKRTVQLVSLIGPGNLGIEIPENNIVINGQPCMLFYTTGKVDMMNTNLIYGAVYGDEVELKNGFKVAYDPCVDSSLGFGPALALVQNIFTEISPSG